MGSVRTSIIGRPRPLPGPTRRTAPYTLICDEPLYLALQFAVACLVGLVLAELVAITGSLWPGIGWQLVYDLTALSTGDQLTPAVLTGLALMTAVLAAYAIWLWRQLPVDRPARTAG